MKAGRPFPGLDALRAGAMVLGLGYHCAIPFIPEIGRWAPLQDATSSVRIALLSDVLHAFRMELFFVLAGFFALRMLQTRTPRAFLAERLKRLGVPFLILLPLVSLGDWALRWSLEAEGRLNASQAVQLSLQPLYLWFLEYLLLFSLLARPLALLLRSQGVRLAVTLLLIPLTVLARVTLGEATPAFSVVPQLASLLHFGAFYVAGAVLFFEWERVRGWALLPWLAPVGLLGAMHFFQRGDRWQPEVVPWGPVITWLCVVGLVSWALRVSRVQGRVVPFLVSASYFVYLVHYPVALVVQALFAPLVVMPAEVKYVLEVLLVSAVSFGVFAMVGRPGAQTRSSVAANGAE